MSDILRKSIVRIKKENGEIVGVGFLVGECRIMTCAHVIRKSLNFQESQPSEKPDKHISLDFPFDPLRRPSLAKVEYWGPSKANGGIDIAGLELIGHAPRDSCSAPLFSNAHSIDDLQNTRYRALGFPNNMDEGIWTQGYVVDERSDGNAQLEDDRITGRSVEVGFSGTPAWHEKSGQVIGIISTADRRKEAKISFMIPIYKILEGWPELNAQPLKNHFFDIPVVTVAMTNSEAMELFKTGHGEFHKIKDFFTKEGIELLKKQYGSRREQWRPYIFDGKTVEVIIQDLFKSFNSDNTKNLNKSENFLPKFVSEEFFDEADEESQDFTRDELIERGGFIIIDLLSLFHSKIRKTFSTQEVGTKVALIGVSPISNEVLNIHKIIEDEIRSVMRQPYRRFSHYDESCELGMSNLTSIKKWIFNLLKNKVKTQSEMKSNPENLNKLWEASPFQERGFGSFISSGGTKR